MSRYWRMVNVLTDTGALELSEAAIYDTGVLVPAVISCTRAATSGTVDCLNDTLATPTVLWDTCTDAGFAIQWDLGVGYVSTIFAPQLRLGSGAVGKFPIDLTLQCSDDNASWITYINYVQATFPGANTLSPLPGTESTEVDPYFDSVVLLLQDSLTDKSSVPKVVTPAGNAAVSTVQSKFGGSSIYFDGAGDYLTIPSSTDFDFGTEDFTIEGWFYCPSSVVAQQCIISRYANGAQGWTLQVYNGYLITALSGDGIDIQGVILLATAGWYHVALTRASGVFRVYLNGVLDGAGFSSASNLDSTAEIRVGLNLGTAYFNGYIDDLRITKGIARYTTNFATPQHAFPAATATLYVDKYYNDVVLLLQDSLTDKSIAPLTVTATGSATVSTLKSIFGGASIYIDGSVGEVTVPFDFSTITGRAFTFELWVYPLADNPKAEATQTIFHFTAGLSAGFHVHRLNSGHIQVDNGLVGATPTLATVPLAAWTHIAVVWDLTNLYCYVNGVRGSALAYPDIGSPTQLRIGDFVSNALTHNMTWNGYLDDIRITKGVARYKSNFPVPTIAFPAVAGVDAYASSVVLALDGEIIADSSKYARAVTAVGNATVSATQSKFGSGSMSFDGTIAKLTTPNSSDFDFSTNDFTIEAWIYIAGNSPTDQMGDRTAVIANTWGSNITTIGGWIFGVMGNASTTGTGIQFDSWLGNGSDATIYRAMGISIAQGVWHHVAASVASGVRRIFLNGAVISASQSNVGAGYLSFNSIGHALNIGRTEHPNYPAPFNGYIDELRITKGVARYIGNFTPASWVDDAGANFTFPVTNPAPPRFREKAPEPSQFAGSDFDPFSAHEVGRVHTFFDVYHGGMGVITGTVKEKALPADTPLHRRVRLIDEASGMLIRETWSDAVAGDYEFRGIKQGVRYTVISYDYTGTYRAVIADSQTPELIP